MTSRLPWVAATLIIAAAVGVWAIWGTTPSAKLETPSPVTTQPEAQTATATLSLGDSVLGFSGNNANSGIAAIYFVKTAQENEYRENYLSTATYSENYYDNLLATGGTARVPIDSAFYILVEAVGHTDNMTSVDAAYMNVELTISGSWSLAAENAGETGADGTENIFFTSATELGMNAVWDNGGPGFIFTSTTESITITARLGTYK